MKVSIVISAVTLLAIAFITAGMLLSNTSLGLTAADREFMNRLQLVLSQSSGVARLSEVKSGDWAKVCVVVGYDRASRVAASELGVSSDAVQFLNSHDAVASDDLWGLVFLKNDNEVEYVQVHSGDFYPGDSTDCIDRDRAHLRVATVHNSHVKRIQLIKL
jgi:hypothetical protein